MAIYRRKDKIMKDTGIIAALLTIASTINLTSGEVENWINVTEEFENWLKFVKDLKNDK